MVFFEQKPTVYEYVKVGQLQLSIQKVFGTGGVIRQLLNGLSKST